MHVSSILTPPAFVCVSLATLSGCATTAELEALRADVDQAKISASKLAAENDKLRGELSALRTEIESTKALSRYRGGDPKSGGTRNGYKWRELDL